MAEYKDEPYFFINTKAGKQYLCKIDAKKYGITLGIDEAGKLVVDEINYPGGSGFMKVSGVFEIILAEVGGKVQPIPVQYSETATGSSSLQIQISEIGTFNSLDETSEAVKAIKAMTSGIIPARPGDIERSSQVIHKFSGRGRK